MLKRLGLTLALLTAVSAFVGCNKDEETDPGIPTSYSSTEISGFNLVKDDSVLRHLDSIYFSIDQVNARIFNADSLPKGTKISRLVLNITYPTSITFSAMEISWARPGQTDSIYDYLNSTQDSVDFSNGPVKLKVVSLDGKAERTYTISVNVHQMEPDSLCWNQMAVRALPTTLDNPKRERTASTREQLFTLTEADGNYCMAVTEDVSSNNWEKYEVSFEFEPVVESFTGSFTALYILDKENNLYTSGDGGRSWIPTTVTMSTIYGGYDHDIIGLSEDRTTIMRYPSGRSMDRPADFPVRGISTCSTVQITWMAQPEFFIVGGEKEDGALSDCTWGFDGIQWAMLSVQKLPKPLKNVTIFPYYSFKVDMASWRVTKHANMLLIGGEDKDGNLNTTTYLSYDYGVHWANAGQLLQLPQYVGSFTEAQAYVHSSLLGPGARSSSLWTEMPLVELPTWLQIQNPQTPRPGEETQDASSRAVKPITEWECPYIYLFGGYDPDGNLRNTIWKGVINRLEFKPLQ